VNAFDQLIVDSDISHWHCIWATAEHTLA